MASRHRDASRPVARSTEAPKARTEHRSQSRPARVRTTCRSLAGDHRSRWYAHCRSAGALTGHGTDPFYTYELHGVGVETLWSGLEAIGMPEHRRQGAVDAVRAIVAAERASGFCWYKVPNTNELAAYWDGCEKTMLWCSQAMFTRVRASRFRSLSRVELGATCRCTISRGVVSGTGSKGAVAGITTSLPCQLCMNPHAPTKSAIELTPAGAFPRSAAALRLRCTRWPPPRVQYGPVITASRPYRTSTPKNANRRPSTRTDRHLREGPGRPMRLMRRRASAGPGEANQAARWTATRSWPSAIAQPASSNATGHAHPSRRSTCVTRCGYPW